MGTSGGLGPKVERRLRALNMLRLSKGWDIVLSLMRVRSGFMRMRLVVLLRMLPLDILGWRPVLALIS